MNNVIKKGILYTLKYLLFFNLTNPKVCLTVVCMGYYLSWPFKAWRMTVLLRIWVSIIKYSFSSI